MNTTTGQPHRPHRKTLHPIDSARTSRDVSWAIADTSLLTALMSGEIALNLMVSVAASRSQITTPR